MCIVLYNKIQKTFQGKYIHIKKKSNIVFGENF